MRTRIVNITLLLLVLATRTLARSRYRRDTAGIGFTDKVSVSAGSNGGQAKIHKGINFNHLLSGDGSKQGGNKGIGLDVTGEAAFKPEVKIQDDGGLGISLGGSAGAGVGISDDSSGILGKIGHVLGAKLGGGAGLGLSLGPGGISANVGGGVSAGAGGGEKHDGYEEHHGHGVGWEEHHQDTANSNGNGAVHWGNSDGYWKKGEIIVIPISDGGNGISGGTSWISSSGANSDGNGDVDAGIIVLPYGDNSGSAGASDGSSNVHVSGGESHSHHVDHGEIKGGGGDVGGGIVISHNNAEQWDSNKGHNNGDGHGSSHKQSEGSIIISQGGHQGGRDESKGQQGASNGSETKDDGKKGGDGNSHIGGGDIVVSYGNAGQSHSDKGHNNGNGNGSSHGGDDIIIYTGHHDAHYGSKGHEETLKANVTKGDGKNANGNKNSDGGGSIIISQGGHYSGHIGSKGHQGSSKGNESKDDGKKGDNDSSHGGGGRGSIVISHSNAGQSSNDKGHNGNGNGNKGGGGGGISINHGKGGGKDVNVTVSVSGGHSGNQSGNSAGHSGGAGGKGSDSHEKNDGHRKNCAGILNNGRCGSNVKETLEYVQTFIRSCDAIVHFLLELKDADLRSVLCRVSPHSSKLSCQLGCNIPRIRPLLDYA